MIKLNKKCAPIFTTKQRVTFLTGGRGSGKSFYVSSFLCILSFEVDQRMLYTRQTMTSAHLSIIPEFTEKIELMNAESKFDVNKTEIINKDSGSEILFKGLQSSSGSNTAQLKSLSRISTWVLDEAEEMQSEDTFDKINLSIRQKDVQNRIILVMNPTDSEHFLYKKYIEKSHKIVEIDGVDVQISTHPDVLHIHTSYLDNVSHLSEQFLQEISRIKEQSIAQATVNGVFDRKLFQKTKYAFKIIGRWSDTSEGVIIEDWREGEFDTSLPYCYGQDYGFSIDPDTLIKVAVDRRKKLVYVHEAYYDTKKLGMEDLYEINKSRIDRPKDLIVGDSAEDRLIADLKKKGLNIIECEKGPGSVRAGITALQDYTIVVTRESYNIKTELKKYVWNDKKAGIPIDAWNHSIDPIRYAFRELNRKAGIRNGTAALTGRI